MSRRPRCRRRSTSEREALSTTVEPDEAGPSGGEVRVVRFDRLPAGRTGEPADDAPAAPPADLGAELGADAATGASADFADLGAALPAGPVATIGAAAAPPGDTPDGHGPDGGDAPVALFDPAELGGGRAEVPVAELGGPGPRRGGSRPAPVRPAPDRPAPDRPAPDRAAAADGDGTPGRGAARDRGAARPGGSRRSRRAPEPAPAGGPGATGQAAGPEPEPDADPVATARGICLRLLTDRARTRLELAQALRRKGVPDEAAHTVLERFDEVGLIDDAAFAEQWVRSRHAYRGLGRRAIAMELRRKGVADEVAGEALAGVDAESEERRARELVDRKLRSLPVDTTERRGVAARRLVGMLARKGYSGGMSYRVVKDALAAAGADPDELGEPGPE